MSDPHVTLAAGDVVIDTTQEFGRSSQFAVYAATYQGRQAAAKTFLSGSSPRLDRLLFREYQTLARLEHDHIVRVFGTTRPNDGRLYLIMERLDVFEGFDPERGDVVMSLKQNIDVCQYKYQFKHVRSWDHATRTIVAQLCEALAYAHRHGVIHNDIKPDNVFLQRRDGELVLKLYDFNASGSRSTRGRPEYTAPERFNGESGTPRSDIYSLGILIFELLTGVVPYPETGVPEALDARNAPVDDLPHEQQQLSWIHITKESPEVAKGLMEILHPEPSRRPRDIAAVIVLLDLKDVVTMNEQESTYVYILVAAAALLLLYVLIWPLSDSPWSQFVLERQSQAACAGDFKVQMERFCSLRPEQERAECFSTVQSMAQHGMCSTRVGELSRCNR